MTGKHALVMGATGLIGWGIVNEILSADTIAPSAFNRVTALVNRPIKHEEMFWPPSHPKQPKLLVVDGVNLMDDEDQVLSLLRERIPDADSITHAYFFGLQHQMSKNTKTEKLTDARNTVFRAGDGGVGEVELNVGMMRTLIHALKSLTPSLEFFIFPGGTRGYGIYQPGGLLTAPLTESLVNTLPESYAKTVAYPAFRRLLSEASEGSTWTWAEICPDMVVGFAPHGSGWSLAAHWAVYLSLWKMVHGEGSEVPFPGTVKGYEAKFTEASTRTLARFAIYASVLKSETCGGGRLFNVADEEGPGTMRERWPLIAAWFGCKLSPWNDLG